MRNLKRALSLGLASAMVLGTMAFSASAATAVSSSRTSIETGFVDNDQISEKEAAFIVTKIGAMVGDPDGSFNPKEPVTRAEMAVVCTTMLNGYAFNVDQFGGSSVNVFDDVPEWAQGYTNLAHELSIVAGVGDNKFNPNDTVTTAEAMLMILRTLGYMKTTEEFGSNWVLGTTRVATNLGLYGDLVLDAYTPLNREYVASIVFRALTDVVEVDFNPTFNAYYNKSSSMTYGVHNDEVEDTLGYTYFGLEPINDVDEFDRPSISWTHKAITIANYAVDPLANVIDDGVEFCEFTGPMTKAQLAQHITGVVNDDEKYTYGIYVDGIEYSKYMGYYDMNDAAASTETPAGFASVMDTSNNGNFIPASTGVLTQIYVVAPEYATDTAGNRYLYKKGKVIVSCVNSHLATVTSVRDNDSGTQTVDVRYHSYYRQAGLEEGLGEPALLETQVEVIGDFELGDVVIVEAAENKTGDTRKIITINHPELVTGSVTSTKQASQLQGGSWMKIDDEQINYAYAMRGNLDAEDEFDVDPVVGTEITAFLDPYGYVIGFTSEVAAINYLYVEDCDTSITIASGGGGALVTLADGTEAKINVTMIDGEAVTSNLWNQYLMTTGFEKQSSVWTDDDGNKYGADENGRNTTKDGIDTYDEDKNKRIFGYNVLSDGSYELTTDVQGKAGNSIPDGTTRSERAGYLQVTESGKFGQYSAGVMYAPVKDSMAVFSSEFYTDGSAATSKKSETTKYNQAIGVDGNSDVWASYTYYIKSGTNAVMVLGAYTAADGTTGTKTDHLFTTDLNTVFVDVVNNQSWVGYNDVPDMTDGDLNFQVVFGTNEIADVVFINNGAPDNSSDSYFVVEDNEGIAEVIDGVSTWTYTVWRDGVEEQIVSKDKELRVMINNVNNPGGLKKDYVYSIDTESDGYVLQVTEQYGYQSIATSVYDGTVSSDYVGDWSVVTSKGLGSFKTAYHDMWDGANNADGLLEDDKDGDNNFSYNDSTMFLKLSSDKDGTYSYAPASVDSIVTYTGANGNKASWVDVITAEGKSTETALAKFVVIIDPWDLGTTAGESVSLSSIYRDITSQAGGLGTSDIPFVLEGNLNTYDAKADAIKNLSSEELAAWAAFGHAEELGMSSSSLSYTVRQSGTGHTVASDVASNNRAWILVVTGTMPNGDEETFYYSLSFDGNTDDDNDSTTTKGVYVGKNKDGDITGAIGYTSEINKLFTVEGTTNAITSGLNSDEISALKYGTTVNAYLGMDGKGFGELVAGSFVSVTLDDVTTVYSLEDFKDLTMGELEGATITANMMQQTIANNVGEIVEAFGGKVSFTYAGNPVSVDYANGLLYYVSDGSTNDVEMTITTSANGIYGSNAVTGGTANTLTFLTGTTLEVNPASGYDATSTKGAASTAIWATENVFGFNIQKRPWAGTIVATVPLDSGEITLVNASTYIKENDLEVNVNGSTAAYNANIYTNTLEAYLKSKTAETAGESYIMRWATSAAYGASAQAGVVASDEVAGLASTLTGDTAYATDLFKFTVPAAAVADGGGSAAPSGYFAEQSVTYNLISGSGFVSSSGLEVVGKSSGTTLTAADEDYLKAGSVVRVEMTLTGTDSQSTGASFIHVTATGNENLEISNVKTNHGTIDWSSAPVTGVADSIGMITLPAITNALDGNATAVTSIVVSFDVTIDSDSKLLDNTFALTLTNSATAVSS